MIPHMRIFVKSRNFKTCFICIILLCNTSIERNFLNLILIDFIIFIYRIKKNLKLHTLLVNSYFIIMVISLRMVDSDDEAAEGPGATSHTLSLTSFLFGNIDTHGQLEGDVFDGECKRQLASLSRLGLGSLLRQVTDDGEDDDDEDDDDEDHEEEEEGMYLKYQ